MLAFVVTFTLKQLTVYPKADGATCMRPSALIKADQQAEQCITVYVWLQAAQEVQERRIGRAFGPACEAFHEQRQGKRTLFDSLEASVLRS